MAQVNDYLISQHFNVQKIADETQYIHEGGANDVFAALASSDPSSALAQLTVSLPALTAYNIGKLVKAGAKHILVWGIPTWSNSPYFLASISAAQRASITQFTVQVNGFIQGNVSAIVPADVDLKFFDTVGFTQQILDNAASYGLVNTTSICLQNYEVFINGTGGQTPIICPNPDQFLFWDIEHPTAKVHGIYGNEIMRILDWQ
jgi:phospholipase/lecithinase/hemolysin